MPGRPVAPRANLIAASTRFGAGIGKKHLVQIWHIFEQAFGQHAGERRDIELHQIGQVAVEHALQGLAQRRMIAANRKNAKTAQ